MCRLQWTYQVCPANGGRRVCWKQTNVSTYRFRFTSWLMYGIFMLFVQNTKLDRFLEVLTFTLKTQICWQYRRYPEILLKVFECALFIFTCGSFDFTLPKSLTCFTCHWSEMHIMWCNCVAMVIRPFQNTKAVRQLNYVFRVFSHTC